MQPLRIGFMGMIFYQKSIKYLLIKFWSALSSFTQFREPCTRFSDYWFRTVHTQRKPLAISGTSHHGQNIDVSFTFAVQGVHHSCLLFNNSWLRPQRPLRVGIKKDAKNSAFLVIWPRNLGRIKGSPLFSRAVKAKSRILFKHRIHVYCHCGFEQKQCE